MSVPLLLLHAGVADVSSSVVDKALEGMVDRSRPNTLDIIDDSSAIVQTLDIGDPEVYCPYSATGKAEGMETTSWWLSWKAPRNRIFVDFTVIMGALWISLLLWEHCGYHCYGGTVDVVVLQGGLFYVNYGRVEDFQVLRSQAINVSAALVIVRAGQISFAEKVNNAEEAGAVGVLIFPENVESPVYGHVHFGTGDPNTPGFPSFNHTQFPPFRSSGLPKMLVQAISLSSARSLLG
ncbi:unnamed protein product [Ranitomeya imitator]|uniref:PA domain-containing protein n=1 Tax=Ranitomeya imitator TaxID=111125 RepID=A0ABN9MGU2_9NEOB|nr:unnamed protein product [Ranitomeya imitator]